MKPDDVNAILVRRRKNNLDYLEITEAGEKLRSEVLSWAVMYCLFCTEVTHHAEQRL